MALANICLSLQARMDCLAALRYAHAAPCLVCQDYALYPSNVFFEEPQATPVACIDCGLAYSSAASYDKTLESVIVL